MSAHGGQVVDSEPRTAVRPEISAFDYRGLLRAVPVALIPIIFWFLPLNLEPKAQHAIAITLFMILGSATEIIDHGLTGLIGCYLFCALRIVTFDVAFSGSANDTPWFLMVGVRLWALSLKR